MATNKKNIERLQKLIASLQKLAESMAADASEGSSGRTRRSSADAEKMKAQIRAARAKGVPAKKLAEKYGVSTAYIYMTK